MAPTSDSRHSSRARTALTALAVALLSCPLTASPPAAAQTTVTAAAAETTPSSVSTTSPLRVQDWLISEKVSRPRSSSAKVDTVIIHFVSDVIENPDRPYDPARVREIFSRFTVSAHYLIDRDGTIYRLVPEERAAFHAGTGKLPHNPDRPGNMNDYSIGIEILAVGSAKDMAIYKGFDYEKFAKEHPDLVGFTDAQYEALNALLDDIIRRRPAIRRDARHILGHSDVDPKRKTDPGELFDWTRIGVKRP